MQQAGAERLRSRFFIDPANWFQVIELPALPPTLQQAVGRSGGGDQVSGSVEGEMFEGAVNAYALVAKANIWYLVAEKSEGEFLQLPPRTD
ncbi:MAG: hypothetical protein U0528_20465 [Anaerolineae bacterium]